MSLERTVIDNIKRIRKEKHISQERLAEYCETSASYIGLMETYKNVPKLSTIERIADALNVPPQELFREDADAAEAEERTRRSAVFREKLKSSILKEMDQKLTELLASL
ncbi:MAG TPA: hypothetical protein DDW78_01425 [Treponema sp.]|nr:hypothetical protein [Treponema sp.]